MNLQAVLREILAADTTITDLVGDAIRPDVLAVGDELPAITVEISDETPLTTLADAATSAGQASILVVCYAFTRATCREIANAVRAALDGYRGTVDGVTIAPCTFSDFTQDLEPAADDSEADWFLTLARFDLFYHT